MEENDNLFPRKAYDRLFHISPVLRVLTFVMCALPFLSFGMNIVELFPCTVELVSVLSENRITLLMYYGHIAGDGK